MFFRRLDLVSRYIFNYAMCCQRDGKRLAILYERAFSKWHSIA